MLHDTKYARRGYVSFLFTSILFVILHRCIVLIYCCHDVLIRALEDDLDPTDPDSELARGTRVPHLDGLSDADCLHGSLNLKLRKHWVCHEHLGEHGEPGVCYVTPTGKHIGVNNRRSNIWTSAMVSFFLSSFSLRIYEC